MKKANSNTPSEFNSKDEAFEFLVKQSQDQELKEYWSKEMKSLPDLTVKQSTRLFFLIKKFSGVAALIIVILGAFYWIDFSESDIDKMAEQMIVETRIAYMPELATRGIESTEEFKVDPVLLAELDKAMENENYERSKSIFSSIERADKLSLEEKFFYALSILKSDSVNHDKGIKLLEEVKLEEDKYYLESFWLQSLLYIKTGEKEKAINELSELQSRSNYKLKNVKALLKVLGEKN